MSDNKTRGVYPAELKIKQTIYLDETRNEEYKILTKPEKHVIKEPRQVRYSFEVKGKEGWKELFLDADKQVYLPEIKIY
ncbi:MAG: hypothetical protein OXC92_00955 [Flavobacteriaceae bacterium]|nr:hypothetical protein [Flavobacteriaceae bacterium]